MARLQMTSEEMSAYAVFVVRQLVRGIEPIEAETMQHNGWLKDKYAQMDMDTTLMLLGE